MLTIDCPWCEIAATVDPEAGTVACDACLVVVELAPDVDDVLELAA